jgi:lipid-binding SYLF domain-containing protein
MNFKTLFTFGGIVMKTSFLMFAAMVGIALLNVGCASGPPATTAERDDMHDSVNATLHRVNDVDPSLQNYLNSAYGYAVFPSIGKGAAGIGGAYGRGEVFERGKFVGYTQMSQATIGAQIGGQSYSELIVFEDRFALQRFELGQVAFDANVSAVALQAGAASSSKFDNGVAVFVAPTGGLMAEASIGGQDFSFEPQ